MIKHYATSGGTLENIAIMKHLKREKFNILPAIQRVQHWWRAFCSFLLSGISKLPVYRHSFYASGSPQA